ncbi:PilC/PilY family type IV pilus protein [Microbulbifer sp. SAOS-129_SWC]|uniref:PilC/PilY family type IV pilus protein n=1 Tax=Microbulbifer sp. SAOS-129_SWC TaxID=3145235 RepID=UPI003216763C
MNKFALKPLLFGLFGFSITVSTCASAEALNLSNAPLQSTGKAEPNLMILLDSSGSMATELSSGDTRLAVAKSAAVDVVRGLGDIRVGLARFNDTDGAKILYGLTSISTSGARDDLITKINAIDATDWTPLAESLADLGRYYVQGHESATVTLHPDDPALKEDVTASTVLDRVPHYADGVSAPTSSDPAIQYYCQKNFILTLTDGLPTQDRIVSKDLQDYDGDCPNGNDGLTCSANDKKVNAGYVYESQDNNPSDYMDDVAQALHEVDWRPDLTDSSDPTHKNNITSYFIGFADDSLKDNLLLKDAGNQGGGSYKYASDASALVTSFNDAIASISNSVGTQSSVAFNSTTLDAGAVIYSAKFDTSDFSGKLIARSLDPDTGRIAATEWEASEQLADESSSTRQIITYLNNTGVPFTATSSGVFDTNSVTPHEADLKVDSSDGSTDDTANLRDDRLAYIRGDTTSDDASGFRPRGTFASGSYYGKPKLLGDIVHSTPVYVGKPELDWPADFGGNSANQSYAQFQIDEENRTPMVYVGANDGMLHGFNANTGEEVFGYIPSLVLSTERYDGLHVFTSDEYSHNYYVDLTPAVSDVYIDPTGGNSEDWHTVLIGGLRGGGKGYFALNVTDPSVLDESHADAVTMWEFDGGDSTDQKNLGYSYSRAQIAKLNNGKWVAIFGNGYNSDNGVAGLFIVDIEAGADGNWHNGDWKFISTGSGTVSDRKNGLSSPRLVDLDGDKVVDRVYAGDLMGNMWAFDLSSSSDSNWSVVGGKPLFKAGGGTPEAQNAILAAPLVARNTVVTDGSSPNVLVMFGTGQYLNSGDLSDNTAGAFYAVWDNGYTETNASLTPSNLVPRTLTDDGTGRKINSGDAIDWTTYYGWRMELDSGSGDYAGERVITSPALRRNTLFFSTVSPNPQPCASSGKGYLMAFDFRTGLEGDDPVADINNDGEINAQDDGYVGKEFESCTGDNCDDGSNNSGGDPGMPGESGFIGDVRCTPGSNGDVICDDIDVGDEEREGRLAWEEFSPQ